MKEIVNFINQFTDQWKVLEQYFDNSSFLKRIANEMAQNIHEVESLDYEFVNSKWGIYIFYVQSELVNDFVDLQMIWNKKGYKNYPKISKKRFEKSIEEKLKRYTFYIGKSENIGKRIREHITHRNDHSTYGLKLNGRAHFENKLSYSYWILPEEMNSAPKEVKQFLITQIERLLRNNLNPWIGKQ